MRSLLSLSGLTSGEISALIKVSEDVKSRRQKYRHSLEGKVLLMLFEKPSLRTRLSFDAAMQTMGGHTITANASDLPGAGKESIEDTARVSSRYVDIIMARMFSHSDLVKFAANSSVPVINGLTNEYHPVQVLSDLLTIKEKKGSFSGLKLCYLGDGNNNVTHSLITGCAHMGIGISVGCPKWFMPKPDVLEAARALPGCGNIEVTQDPLEAARGADIIYTDSWMSYHIPEREKDARIRIFMPYQVNSNIVKHAKEDCIFMNCLPAMRGYEQTAEIIDGKNSVVFDQAENRLHMQKAVLMECLK